MLQIFVLCVKQSRKSNRHRKYFHKRKEMKKRDTKKREWSMRINFCLLLCMYVSVCEETIPALRIVFRNQTLSYPNLVFCTNSTCYTRTIMWIQRQIEKVFVFFFFFLFLYRKQQQKFEFFFTFNFSPYLSSFSLDFENFYATLNRNIWFRRQQHKTMSRMV